MSILKDFDEIMDYAHFWNWLPDWNVLKEIYETFPDAYSVLTPFAYSYLEEIIRTTTSDYGMPLFDRNEQPIKLRVGMNLIKLATEENQGNLEYVKLLESVKKHYQYKHICNDENGRNKVMHGHVHPRFWSKESFEQLIHDIALLSQHSKF